jgi:hypothetical protein
MIVSLALMILGSGPAFAVGGKYGFEAEDEASVNNAGAIVVDGTVAPTSPYVEGIHATNTTGNVANSGSIDAFASDEDAIVYGIRSSITGGDIRNSGTIEADAEAEAYAYSYGIRGTDTVGDIVNSGDIEATADSIDYAFAYGIMGRETLGSILNSGSILAEAEAHNTYAAGIDARDTGGDIINSGDIEAYARSMISGAYGLNIDGAGGDVINSGDILAFAESDVSTSAWGIFADDVAGSILNSGSIFAETISLATADAWGIYTTQTYGDISNDGQITAISTGYTALSWGIFAQYTTGSIINSGTLEALGLAENGGQAKGIYAAHTDGDIINSGSLIATATGSYDAYTVEGIYADYTGGNIVNSGTIEASAVAGDYSEAAGVIARRTEGGFLNSGSISVLASANDRYSTAWGADLYDIGGTVENSGLIEVRATCPVLGWAYGLEVGGGGTLINTGSISVDGRNGTGIFVTSGSWDIYNPGYVFTEWGTRTLWLRHSGVSTLKDDFRIIFNGDPEAAAYLEPILVSSGTTLNLGDATLLAQAGNGIVWNTPYPVIENAGTVNEEFLALQSANPNIGVSWEDSGSTGEDAAVVFDYAPKASAAAQGLRMANLGVMQAGNLIQQRTFSELLARYIRQQETMLADSGQTATDSGFLVARAQDGSGSAAFIRPYLHTVNHPSDGDMGYDGSLLGIVAGYEWLASRELTMGLHAGLGVGSIDFKGTGYDSNDEEQQVYSLGLHGAYNPGAWHFDGSATLYAANHEYEGLTGGLTIEEEDDYTSYGAEAEAIGGYVFSSGRCAAMPYAGLGYSWINAPSHTSDADDSNWDTDYDSVDEHIVRSILGGQISASWAAGETKVIPTLGLRWEYALTDNEISVSQSLPGTGSVEVDDEVDQSSFIADASVVFVKGAASMELGATSLYNDDYTSYGGWLTLKWEF